MFSILLNSFRCYFSNNLRNPHKTMRINLAMDRWISIIFNWRDKMSIGPIPATSNRKCYKIKCVWTAHETQSLLAHKFVDINVSQIVACSQFIASPVSAITYRQKPTRQPNIVPTIICYLWQVVCWYPIFNWKNGTINKIARKSFETVQSSKLSFFLCSSL